MTCEDAPCCGCCGTNLYGVRQDDTDEPPWCDMCGGYHFGDCDEIVDELIALEEDEGDDDPDLIELYESMRPGGPA